MGTLCDLLASIETAALRTQGQVVSVISSTFTIAWNTGTRCPNHVDQCGHFVNLLRMRQNLHIGAMSGLVMSGNISGIRRRRYVTVAGDCVELSLALAEAAALKQCAFMVAGGVGMHLGIAGAAARMEVWEEQSSNTRIEVWMPVQDSTDLMSDVTEEVTITKNFMGSFKHMWVT
eukprot:Hpha_TRINITY_DN15204_c5_g1::TRINITY_DN15204_c5_g1_i1::g.67428::m.67428